MRYVCLSSTSSVHLAQHLSPCTHLIQSDHSSHFPPPPSLHPSPITHTTILINLPQADDIAAQTKAYKGLRCTVKLTVKNRQAAIEVVPSASLLVIKGLKEPERDRKKEKNILHNGNLTLAAVIEMAKSHRARSRSANLAGVVKEILGTALSVGATVDGKSPKEITAGINNGTIKVE